MHQQSFFVSFSFVVLFISHFSIASELSGDTYNKAITNLSLIFRQEPKVGAKAINRFQDEIASSLKEHDLFSVPYVASIFRFALMHRLAEHRIMITPGLSKKNLPSI